MAITCCCGITRISHARKEDSEETCLLKLANVISFSEVEDVVQDVVRRLFKKPNQINVQWQHKALEKENHTNPNPNENNNCEQRQADNKENEAKHQRIIVSGRQLESYVNIFGNNVRSSGNDKFGVYVPIFDENEPNFVAQLKFFVQTWDSNSDKLLRKLERQLKTTFQRLNRMQSNSPYITVVDQSTVEANRRIEKMTNELGQNYITRDILELCGELYEQNPVVLQSKIINFLKQQLNYSGGFILLLSNNGIEFECGSINSKSIDPEKRYRIENSILEGAVLSKTTLILNESDLEKQLGSMKDLEQLSEQKWSNLLAVPICNRSKPSRVTAVVCLFNKQTIVADTGDSQSATLPDTLPSTSSISSKDEKFVNIIFHYIAAVLNSNIAFCVEKRLKNQTETMLQVAMNIFRKLDDLPTLLKEIMTEAKKLTNAERCSVFLLENETNELVAKVFDGLPTVSSDTSIHNQFPKEIRIPATQGIAGQVASTGEILNIHDAYSHPLFYRGVDAATGYRTRNILCFPIKGEDDKIMGIAQLCNKLNGPNFTCYDEDLARAFSVYCCISIEHSLMYKNVQEAQHRNKLATELMTYHMQITEENFRWLSNCTIPKGTDILPNFNSFDCVPRVIEEKDSLLAILSMFQQLNFLSRWRISRSILARFVLMVKRGYRDPPYHNWTHAFSVAHFAYLSLLKLPSLLTELEMLAFFVASLCHDIDHRGTNNSFQVTSKSVLAALYSSEGSVLERHHFNQTICILNSDNCNIFEQLSAQDYQTALDLIRDIILATDLAHHFKVMSQQQTIFGLGPDKPGTGYQKSDPEHRKLLLFLLMTCSDLSDQSKGWANTRNVAMLIYEEFFSQGDLEKAIGQNPCEQMDRERACIPSLQITFLDTVALPCFELFSAISPKYGQGMLNNIASNRANWQKLHDDIKEQKISANKFQIFQKDLSPLPDKKIDSCNNNKKNDDYNSVKVQQDNKDETRLTDATTGAVHASLH